MILYVFSGITAAFKRHHLDPPIAVVLSPETMSAIRNSSDFFTSTEVERTGILTACGIQIREEVPDILEQTMELNKRLKMENETLRARLDLLEFRRD